MCDAFHNLLKSNMHVNTYSWFKDAYKSMLFFIERGKLWCILYSSKWLWNTCIKYPLPVLVYIFCLQQFSCIFESTVHNNWWMLTTFMLNLSLSFFMPPKELWEAYSNRTVRPSVRVSVPLLCPVHISYILWGRNSKFGVWIHLGMGECRVPFSGHCDLDLWPSF